MQRLFKSFDERDERRYAAVEAVKLGYGGITYISQLLNCDPKTVQAGLLEIDQIEANDDLETSRQRKKGWTKTLDQLQPRTRSELPARATRSHCR